jgi:hypothetical protein
VAQKKVRDFALEQRRQLISPKGKLSLCKQCELLGVGRSSWYYQPQGQNADNLALMRALDELYTRWPFYGVRRRQKAARKDGRFFPLLLKESFHLRNPSKLSKRWGAPQSLGLRDDQIN